MVSRGEVAECLEKAADLYESETIGWCRNQPFWYGSPVSACALGAISLAAGSFVLKGDYVAPESVSIRFSRATTQAEYLVSAAGTALKDHLHMSVPVFNDDIAAGKQDVIDAMKACAKELRNEA